MTAHGELDLRAADREVPRSLLSSLNDNAAMSALSSRSHQLGASLEATKSDPAGRR